MEAVILCGVQGSGKTTLYRDRFLETHARVSLDLLRTRAREAAFLRTCLETRMPFVVDNTNPTVAERARYVDAGARGGVQGRRLPRRGRPRGRRGPQRRARADGAGRRRCATSRGGSSGPTPEEGFDELFHATAALDGGWRDRAAAHDTAAVLSVVVDRGERVGARA